MFLNWLNRWVDRLITLLGAVIVALVTIEVALRYLAGGSLIFTDELARYLMVWIVFLGAGVAFRDNSHIAISLVTDHLPAGARRKLALVTQVLSVLFPRGAGIEGVKILPAQSEQACITLPSTWTSSTWPFPWVAR